ncbi:hypothetical protein LIER_20977 [Lithospermum erythrorhizon]|uniref:Aminotransferase-like plant mobile domain-containing protein n=1 Tax=Lithospermum erythrorhizon TaxID=34254 RepID=A0AAV3QQY9_LITER
MLIALWPFVLFLCLTAMVIFETTPDREFSTLRIVGPEEDKVTTLVAHVSWYRGCAAKWLSFHTFTLERSRNRSSVQEREWAENVLNHCGAMLTSASLTEAVQASLCVYDCSDEFLKAFCENWCPSTNTLIIPQGEPSISLWVLLELGDLPVTSFLFDEVVPTAEYLSQSLGDEARIPVSCRFLLSSYHYLAAQSLMGASSVFDLHPWASAEKHPFDVLRVGFDLEEEYCAALLACWLCVFVLPVEPLDLIRGSVFKMASFMANGSSVSLAPPALAFIYKSLSQISLLINLLLLRGAFLLTTSLVG